MNDQRKIISCLNCEDRDMELVKCADDLFINKCEKCGGIWLDKGELNDLTILGEFYIKNLDNNMPVLEKNRIRECPRCEVVLIPANPPGMKNLKIDRCPDCKGIWLDRGELLKLVEYYK